MARPADKVGPIELETERFRLVPIRPMSLVMPTWHWTADKEAFANLGWRTTGWTKRRWWRHLRHQVRRDRQTHGIWPKAGGPCIGLHLAKISSKSGIATIGVFVGEKEWWGKGVVDEVRRAIIDDCFERLNLQRIWAQVHVRNLPSVYNHRKLGFTHEGTLRSSVVADDGSRMDMLIYGLLREEWLAGHENGATDGD